MGREARRKLFDRQLLRTGDLAPGETLEVKFRLRGPATVTVIGVGRRPNATQLLEQGYRVELQERPEAVPVAAKDSLRGIVVTAFTHTVGAEGRENWAARVRNTGSRPQSLSLLVAIA